MWSILVSAARWVLSFVLRGVVIKFVVLGALAAVISWVVSYVLNGLDISPLEGLQNAVGGMPQAVIWLMNLFRVDFGLPIILGAMVTKFLIRRIPLIG